MIRHDIEQNTSEWDAIRLGIPTASCASKLVTGTGQIPKKTVTDGYANDLAAELFAGQSLNSFGGNKSTEYGHEVEPESRAWYAYEYNKTLIGGAFYTDDLERYGASPDDITSDGRIVELKNFPKSHIEVLLYWKKHGKCPPARFGQVQFQMMTCECDVADLVFYSPTLPKLVIEVPRDDDYCAKLKSQITACLLHRDSVLEILNSYKEVA